jgi:hypothetical protein
VTMVVYVGTEEGSCLRAVDTAVVVDVVDVADGGNEAAAWHDSPWATLAVWIPVLDHSSYLHLKRILLGEESPRQTIPKGRCRRRLPKDHYRYPRARNRRVVVEEAPWCFVVKLESTANSKRVIELRK